MNILEQWIPRHKVKNLINKRDNINLDKYLDVYMALLFTIKQIILNFFWIKLKLQIYNFNWLKQYKLLKL